MPWKHVYAPVKGMITNAPPSGIPPEASPYIKGCYLKDGEVCSDFGYTAFPTAGLLKTNLLHGSIMKIDQFYLASGDSYLITLTTTNAYKYNTTSETWEVITKGVLVDNCESAWTAKANVTSTADTSVKLVGSKSAKHVIAAGFTTGIASTFDFAAADCTTATALHFMIYSTVATAAGDLKVGISETAVCAAGVLYFDVPALVANTWTPCCVAGTFTGYNAVISVCLNVVTDLGAQTVYLDDIVAVDKFTGDEDNRFSTATMNDTFLVTNGVDQPQVWTGSGYLADFTTTLAAGAITTSEMVFSFKDHLLLMNNTENAADCPQRVSWTNIGKTEEWTGGTSGYQDLVDDISWIVGAAMLSENSVIIYKERSIVEMTWVGGHTPFRFKTQVLGTGALSKDAVDSGTGEHIVVGPDLTFAYKGGTEIEILDDKIKRTMYGRISREYANRLFIIYLEEDDELQIWIPTDTAYPDEVWCLNVIDEIWYRKARTMTCAGYYQEQSSFTIGDLIGTIGEQNWKFGDALTKSYSPITLIGDSSGYMYKLDKTTLNNNGAAITNEFQTPDFVLPDSEHYMNRFMRVSQLIYEASGQSVTTHYSTDSGNSWSPTQGAGGNVVTLGSIYDNLQQDFDVTSKKIRFRFMNTTASSGFKLRYYGFYWTLRSGRK
jgi:hypothetical protein